MPNKLQSLYTGNERTNDIALQKKCCSRFNQQNMHSKTDCNEDMLLLDYASEIIVNQLCLSQEAYYYTLRVLKLLQIFQIVQSDSGVLLSRYHAKPCPFDRLATDFMLYNSARFIRASILQPFHQSQLMYLASDVTPRFQFHQCHEMTHAAHRLSDFAHKFFTTPHK